MAKQPFTSAGVDDKIEELYLLPAASLQTEIGNIRSDFKDWMNDHFNLSTTQQTYLNNIDSHFLASAAGDLAIALDNGLSVSLVITGTVSASKLIRKQNDLDVEYHPVNGVSATGSLTFTMVYQ